VESGGNDSGCTTKVNREEKKRVGVPFHHEISWPGVSFVRISAEAATFMKKNGTPHFIRI